MIKTVEWTNEGVRMIDQRLLPTEEKYLTLRSYEEVAEAIKKMVVRGAPAIGVSAAFGLALGAKQSVGTSVADLEDDFGYMCEVMSKTRPTAVNLFWAIERMRKAFNREKARTQNTEEIKANLVTEALNIFQEDIDANRSIGHFGEPLIPDGATVLTHCNAGALATAGDYGTALGVIRGARDAGKRVAVIADETRPFLQGLRLTAWELAKDNIPVTVITDGMAGHVMKGGKVDCVVVGADRIAANGDTANKIGTYMVAVLAKENAQIHLKHSTPDVERAIAVTLKSLDDIQRWCEDRKIPLVLLIIPHSLQIYQWELAKWQQAYNVSRSDFDLDRPQRILSEWGAKKNVTVADLLPHFRAYQASHPDDRLYLYPDVHMNAGGHREAAAVLQNALKTALRSPSK